MSFSQQLEIIRRLHNLIRRRATGSAIELAQRLDLSRASVHRYLNALKDLGAEINYCKSSRSYYYEKPFEFKL